MSSYTMKAKEKKTGEIVDVFCIDDYFGSHQYGYSVPNKLGAYTEEQFYSLYEEETCKQ